MAMRGRGRGGWRGGRGGGRGGMQVPGLKDEDGNPIAMSVVSDGPPLQFPVMRAFFAWHDVTHTTVACIHVVCADVFGHTASCL